MEGAPSSSSASWFCEIGLGVVGSAVFLLLRGYSDIAELDSASHEDECSTNTNSCPRASLTQKHSKFKTSSLTLLLATTIHPQSHESAKRAIRRAITRAAYANSRTRFLLPSRRRSPPTKEEFPQLRRSKWLNSLPLQLLLPWAVPYRQQI